MSVLCFLSWLLLGILGVALLPVNTLLALSFLGLFASIAIIAYPLALRGGAPFTAEVPVYYASRWFLTNLLFPTQVAVFPSRVVRHKKRVVGANEESINITQIASVRIQTNLIWSNVVIESSGGTDPIIAKGHTNTDARTIKAAIESYQQRQFTQTPLPTADHRASSSPALQVLLTLYTLPNGQPATSITCSTDDPHELTQMISSLLQTGGSPSHLTVRLISAASDH